MIRRSRGGLLKGAALSCILTLGGAGYADQGLSPTEHAAGASHPAHISSPSTLESIVETPDDKVETPVAKPDRKTLFSQMYNIEPVEDSKPLVPVGEVDVTDGYHLDDTVKVGHWNLEIYGNKKAFGHNGKRRLLIAKEIKKYDILFLQEISDARGNAIQALCDDLPGYNCWASSRAGGRYHKEQIVVVARNYIPLMDSHDYNPNKDFTRPPVSATFIVPGQQGNLVGKFWSTHVDPDRVATELRQWEKLVESANTQHPEYW
ncbi:MAG: endonuclease/exonuclease/phosphatase family protein [Candidatus Nanoarchaeia archaeon]